VKILFLHWGKSGAGPTLIFEVFREASNSNHEVFASVNLQSENIERYGNSNRVLTMRTYRSRKGFAFLVYRIFTNGLLLRRFLKKEAITHVVSIMESPYQSLSIPIWKSSSIRYLSVIHDVTLHPGEAGPIAKLMRLLELKYADVAIALSKNQAAELQKVAHGSVVEMKLPITGGKASHSVEASPPFSGVKIVFFGRLQPYKGLNELLGAVELLETLGIDNFELEIIGDGPLRELSKLNANPRVKWKVGWIPESEIDQQILGADLVVFPYQSGSQSGVITQCQKLGIPMILSPIPGLMQQVITSGGAYICTGSTATALAHGLRECLTNDGLLDALRSQLLASKDLLYWSEAWSRDLIDLAKSDVACR